jgi:hypothetical protein
MLESPEDILFKQDIKFEIKRLLERSPVKLINLTNYLKKFTIKLGITHNEFHHHAIMTSFIKS